MQKYIPNAYVFSILLTLIVLAITVVCSNHSVISLIHFWGSSLHTLNEFAMQMALILILGFVLARTSLVQFILKKTASLPKNNTQAVILVTVVSLIACYLNWGFGLVVSAFICLAVAQSLPQVNFPLLVASSYSGFLIWHGGLSGSVPLKLTEQAIPLAQTIFANYNFVLIVSLIFVLLFINVMFSRNRNYTLVKIPKQIQPETPLERSTLAQKLEHSSLLNYLFAGIGAIYLVSNKNHMDINLMIFLFLWLAILLHKTPHRLMQEFNLGAREAASILLLFPLYAGIMGLMGQSGIAQALSEFFVSISNQNTFLMFTYWSAGIVNFVVPSGGGQWAMQGPIMIPAGLNLGIDPAKTAMAIAWGDAWTNMIQPFWALPILSLAKLELKDIYKYCVMICLAVGVVHSLIFYILI
jgi:short-chain fatty acids transporter